MNSNDIALALSGGGVRALAFHSGVLRYLAEKEQLERVKYVSTVSGASLLIGLVFHRSSMVWPSSTTYLRSTAPQIKKLVTTNVMHGVFINTENASVTRLKVDSATWARFGYSPESAEAA